MYHGKTTPELEQLSEEYYKMFGHFLQDMRNWNMEKMIIKLM